MVATKGGMAYIRKTYGVPAKRGMLVHVYYGSPVSPGASRLRTESSSFWTDGIGITRLKMSSTSTKTAACYTTHGR